MKVPILASIACLLLAPSCREARVSPADPLGTRATTSPAAVASDCSAADYPGPWTACPEAEWVRTIAEAAGYEISGDTGSALIAKGGGHSFYLWATRGLGSLGGVEGESPLCRAGGVSVWSGMNGMEDWRYWHAQGFTFWISAGPHSTSRAPDPCDLDRLVRASEAPGAP